MWKTSFKIKMIFEGSLPLEDSESRRRGCKRWRQTGRWERQVLVAGSGAATIHGLEGSNNITFAYNRAMSIR